MRFADAEKNQKNITGFDNTLVPLTLYRRSPMAPQDGTYPPPDRPPTTPEPFIAPDDASVTVRDQGTINEALPDGADGSPAASAAEGSIRVSVTLLDQLMNLAGELVLSRNQLLQTINSGSVHEAEAVGQRIDLVTSELQGAIMLTRMQPIGTILAKIPRQVRDLSKEQHKETGLSLIGQEVELDKTILEAINAPLTQLVCNRVIHGIEPARKRQDLGKDPCASLTIKAYHAAGQVVIAISDDGRGIDGKQLAERAVAKGVLTAEQAQLMSAKERLHLLLLPEFSADEHHAGAAKEEVGLAAIKESLDQLGGSMDIDSVPGQGTTIAIKLPLTLAIIPCQIVMTGNERYAIPQVNLEELLRIAAAQVKDRVERVGDAEVVRLRGNLLPLIRMADALGIERTYLDPEQGDRKADRRHNIADRRGRKTPSFALDAPQASSAAPAPADQQRKSPDRRQSPASALNIVVVSTGSFKYGLIVDSLLDSEEIVIKPLGRHLQQCQGYAGATIMGDGRIALILDVADLACMAGLTSVEGSKRAAEVASEALAQSRERQAFLTFRSGLKEQFAVPLNLVERVEKIDRSEIEVLGSRRVLQYRDSSLPLVRVDDAAAVEPVADQDNLLVIVFRLAGRDVGLLACGPVDAVEVTSDIDTATLRQTGIMGSTIIGGTTTMLVDIHEIVGSLHPQWVAEPLPA
jgi:two-component system, chemotaxis family, sensor kinase CheA